MFRIIYFSQKRSLRKKPEQVKSDSSFNDFFKKFVRPAQDVFPFRLILIN